jgi:hypothetical protein
MALPKAKNLAFMFVRYRFSMALCAAFLRFMTAAASVSCASIERADLVLDVLEEETDDDLGEASGEDGEEVEDDVEALEGLRGLVVVVVFSVCWEVREVTPMVSRGDKLPLLVSLLCDGDHISLSGSW